MAYRELNPIHINQGLIKKMLTQITALNNLQCWKPTGQKHSITGNIREVISNIRAFIKAFNIEKLKKYNQITAHIWFS
jgi:hypothetical protein